MTDDTVFFPNRRCRGGLKRARIDSLNEEGVGVGRVEGKVSFIEGALQGEEVEYCLERSKPSYDRGWLVKVIEASPLRVEPRCEYFGICGGCSLQHLDPPAQIKAKHQILADKLWQFGQIKPRDWLPPLTGPLWGYRRSARLGARFVANKGGILVGFRERGSKFITSLKHCAILDPRIGDRLAELHTVIGELSCYNRLPQVETVCSDDAVGFVFRHLEDLTDKDRALLRTFGERHGIRIYLQAGGPDSIRLLWPEAAPTLEYRLPEYDVRLQFAPTHFIQVNSELNRRMVQLAIELLAPEPDDVVLDLFCGLGNFTLPLARRSGRAVGVEAEQALVDRGRENARLNGLDNCEFLRADLYQEDQGLFSRLPACTRLLLDPPRGGAIEVIKQLPKRRMRRIVYVSCNPVTLARDAEYLCNVLGYTLDRAGVMDMFPQTSHVESIAVFDG